MCVSCRHEPQYTNFGTSRNGERDCNLFDELSSIASRMEKRRAVYLEDVLFRGILLLS
jgi:hypothetical protein